MKLKVSNNPINQEEEICCNNPSCCETSSPYVRDFSKVGRNEKCPCGSGNKFKRCCGK
tara:strand:+ start:598 stop:771 length:174 start_codon:yes stop_codon:yes gene_type:complete